MNKINFQDLPNETTPINATNLNQMQTNIDNAKVEVSSTLNGVDLNTVKDQTAFYYCNDCTNRPIASNGYFFVQRLNNNYIRQEYTTAVSNLKYIRTCNNGTWTDWISLLPETITNSNGTAVKFPDGTMICYLNIRVTDQEINTRYGNIPLYFGRRTWTFPQEFINDNVSVTCGTFRWSTGGSWGSTSKPNKTNVTLFGYDLYTRPADEPCDISATAIGRWK